MYEGYVNIHIYPTPHGTFGFINKVLDMPSGMYCMEFPTRNMSILVPLKYSRHRRKNRRAGGDSGVFRIPQTFLKTLVIWGIQEGYTHIRIWGTDTTLKNM